jgi:hypothetical protein
MYKDHKDYRQHKGLQTGEEFIANGTVQLNLGSDAEGDLYYRSSNGQLARLPIGAAGTFIKSNGTVPVYSTIPTQYTNAMAIAAVGAIIQDSSSIDFTFDNAVPSITATVKDPYVRGLFSGGSGINYNSATGQIAIIDGYVRSLFSNSTGINYNSATGVIQLVDSYVNTLADARIALQKGAANGIAPLGADSKVPTAYLPALAITDTFVVGSQAAMLALTAQTGDVAVRTDLTKTYILAGTDPTVLGNWVELLNPGAPVISVNGFTGAVSLSTTNIPEGTNLYYTQARFNTAFAAKSTTDLVEGVNLYYTNGRVQTFCDANYIINNTSSPNTLQPASFYVNIGKASNSFQANIIFGAATNSFMRQGRAGSTYINFHLADPANPSAAAARNHNLSTIGNTAYFQALGEAGSYWDNVHYGGYNDVGTQPHITFGFGSMGQHRFFNSGNVTFSDGTFVDDGINRVQINGSLKVSSLATSGTAPTTTGALKMLVSDVNGRVSFQDYSATSPGGANTNIQFNNAGVFGGSSNNTWNNNNRRQEIIGDLYVHDALTNPSSGGQRGYFFSDYLWNAVGAQPNGSVMASGIIRMDYTLNANVIMSAACIHSANMNWLRLGSSVNSTVTSTGPGNGRRAVSSNAVFVQLNNISAGIVTTITDVAGLQIYGLQSEVANPVNTVSISNYYQLLIGNDDEYPLMTAKVQNRYAIFQESSGASNIFKSKSHFGASFQIPTSEIDIDGRNPFQQLRLRQSATPTSSSDTNGAVGDYAWDELYTYVKTVGGWRRQPHSLF